MESSEIQSFVYYIFFSALTKTKFISQGVPIRVEIGPRDVLNKSVVVSRRDIPGKQGKVFGVSMEPDALVPYVKDKLDEIQASLLSMATSFRDRYVLVH